MPGCATPSGWAPGTGWEEQGRQEHGWFGHGTGLGSVGGLAERVTWAAHSSLTCLPRQDWGRQTAIFDSRRLGQMQTAMAAWVGARLVGRQAFNARFMGRPVGDAAIDSLRASAEACCGKRFLPS